MIKKITEAITPLKHVEKINEVIDKFNSFYKRQVGEIIPVVSSASYVPEGTLPCDGAEYTKAQFNDLWENYLVTGEGLFPINKISVIGMINDNGFISGNGSLIFDNLFSEQGGAVLFSFTTSDDVVSEQTIFFVNGQPIIIKNNVITYSSDYDETLNAVNNIEIEPDRTYTVLVESDDKNFVIKINNSHFMDWSQSKINSFSAGSNSFNGCFLLGEGHYLNTETYNYEELVESRSCGYLNTCTYEEYELNLATYGQCSKFGIDINNEKFRVPLIKDTETVVTNNIDYENGITLSTTLPLEATPYVAPADGLYYVEVYKNNERSYLYINGVESNYYYDRSDSIMQTPVYAFVKKGDVIYWSATLSVNYSKFYPYKEKTKEKLKSFVVVANGQVNQSLMDWSAWASSLQGKMNADHSNDTKPYIVEVSDKSISPSWYRVWSDGWCEQGGVLTSNNSDTLSVSLLKNYIGNYSVLFAQSAKGSTSAQYYNTGKVITKNSDSFIFGCKVDEKPTFDWEAKGYIR